MMTLEDIKNADIESLETWYEDDTWKRFLKMLKENY